jgi:hypothetical protein
MNTRQKGMILSKYVADQIVSKQIDVKACADGASGAGNREKADVHTSMLVLGIQAGIECKNQKNINHKDSWRQTKKLEKLGCEPILVFKDFGEPLEESKAIIYLDTLLELIKSSKTGKIEPQSTKTTYTDNTIKYRTQRAISELKELIKILENGN